MTLFEVRMSPNVTSQWREGGTDTPVDNDADADDDDDDDGEDDDDCDDDGDYDDDHENCRELLLGKPSFKK